MKKFKIFFCFLNQCTSDYYRAKFRWNWTTLIFWPLKSHFRGLKESISQSCPISTKFCVVIVRSTLIRKTKKNFEIFHFSADFFSWSLHARLVKKIFFVKKLFFVHIFILKVQILSTVVHLKSRSAIYTLVDLASELEPSGPRGSGPS